MVIAIISILASLLLPTLARSKERARITQCLSNFRQMGIGLALFCHDHEDAFPTEGYVGGFDPQPARFPCLPTADQRPLYPYIRPSDVFHCPMDHGIIFNTAPCWPLSASQFDPTCWETAGSSYFYNGSPRGIFLKYTPEDIGGVAGQKTGNIPNPSNFILMFEPPATGWSQLPLSTSFFTHWHYIPQRRQTPIGDVPNDPKLFISPILFVDGHAAIEDFSRTIRADPSLFQRTHQGLDLVPAVHTAAGFPGHHEVTWR